MLELFFCLSIDIYLFFFFFLIFLIFVIKLILNINSIFSNFFNIFEYIAYLFVIFFCSFYLLNNYPIINWTAFDFFLVHDILSFFFRLIGLVFFLFFILFFKIFSIKKIEYYFLIGFSFLLLFFLLICYDLMLIYIIIEIISLIFYSLSAIGNNSIKQAEAAIKYFVLGVTASIFFLYAISLIYGLFGSLNFLNIYFFLLNDLFFSNNYTLIYFSFLLFFISFLFKLGIAPFHIWLIEVYSGITWLLFFFFSIFPKYIYFCFLIKIFFYSFGKLFSIYFNLFFILSLLSILIGSLGILNVKDLKKFLIYGSINHIGFIFSCFFCGSIYSFVCTFIYLLVYILLLFTFFCIFFFQNDNKDFYIYELNILKQTKLGSLFIFAFCFFSMAGVPPFLGFFSKFLVSLNFYFYANSISSIFCILFFSVLSTFGYIRLVAFLFFDIKKIILMKVKGIVLYFIFLNFLCFINCIGIYYIFNVMYLIIYIFTTFLFLC